LETNILLKPPRTYFRFYKKGSLNPQAVRIRVKTLILTAGGPNKGPFLKMEICPL
jgi:hypothetical protein